MCLPLLDRIELNLPRDEASPSCPSHHAFCAELYEHGISRLQNVHQISNYKRPSCGLLPALVAAATRPEQCVRALQSSSLSRI
jgi:hypothetical protein